MNDDTVRFIWTFLWSLAAALTFGFMFFGNAGAYVCGFCATLFWLAAVCYGGMPPRGGVA